MMIGPAPGCSTRKAGIGSLSQSSLEPQELPRDAELPARHRHELGRRVHQGADHRVQDDRRALPAARQRLGQPAGLGERHYASARRLSTTLVIELAHGLVALVHDRLVKRGEPDVVVALLLLLQLDVHAYRVADLGRGEEAHLLHPVEGDDRPGLHRYQSGGVGEHEHPVRDPLAEHRLRRPLRVNVQRVRVPRQRGEVHDVRLGDRPALGRERVPDREVIQIAREHVGRGRFRCHDTSTIASTSTDISNGSSAAPIAERA